MCRLTWSSSSLAVLTRGQRTQRLQPNHVIFVSKSSRRINYTQETAEPLGVSPPEAVDLLLIKMRLWFVAPNSPHHHLEISHLDATPGGRLRSPRMRGEGIGTPRAAVGWDGPATFRP